MACFVSCIIKVTVVIGVARGNTFEFLPKTRTTLVKVLLVLYLEKHFVFYKQSTSHLNLKSCLIFRVWFFFFSKQSAVLPCRSRRSLWIPDWSHGLGSLCTWCRTGFRIPSYLFFLVIDLGHFSHHAPFQHPRETSDERSQFRLLSSRLTAPGRPTS